VSTNDITRRALLGAASAAAVGLAGSADASAAPVSQPDAPRLPLTILLRAGLSTDFLRQLRDLSPQITASQDVDLAAADVVLGNISPAEVQQAAKLKWVQCISAGVEHLPLKEFIDRDIVLTNGQGAYAPEIAEHAFGLLFALTRGIGQQVRQMAEKKWGYPGEPIELRGMTIGIIGLGGIGREVACRAKAMSMKVLAVDAEPLYVEKFPMVDDVRLVDDGLIDLLKTSDVVISCVPSTPRSRGMLGAEQFAAMKRGAYFLNVSRGKIVKTDALLDALKSGQLAGAGLDVTDPEPLPPDHPLWQQPNAVITSHIAGRSQLSWQRVQTIFVTNVARWTRGQPLLNVVDKAKGY
jgi:phosphoglycerate dehydrogenase-like enzyme